MLCSAIDETIADLLSLSVMESLYKYLRVKYQISRDEVPYRLDTFSLAIANLFGVNGGRTVGKIVARNLYARLTLEFTDKPNFTLSDYVDEAKEELQSDLSYVRRE